jgi:DNA-binding CsgD family transcriptional regulator
MPAGCAAGDPGAAARLLARACDEPPAVDQRGHVLLELANAELEQGMVADAAEHLDRALALLNAPVDRARALATLGRLHLTRGEHEAGAAAMNEAMAQLEPVDPVLLADYLTLNTFRASLHPFAEERLRSLIEAARQGRPPEDPGLLAHLVLRLAFAAEPAGRIRSLADARRRGSLFNYTAASYHRAIARYHRGDLTGALADLDQALTYSGESWTSGDPWTRSLQVHAHLERGDFPAARDTLKLAVYTSADSMDAVIVAFARARLLLAEGQPAAALADAETAGRILETGFGIDHPGFVPWRRTAALAARILGQADRSRTLSGQLLERARWSGTARAIGLALRTQAAVSEDERSLPLLAEAVAVLQGSPSTLERAHALVEFGAARRRTGQRSEARDPLREGLQLADRMGAVPLIQTAFRELHVTGARPRRAAHSGADALTPTEHRVADLAAEGMTNAQIAQALFVTAKTIETHLAHAYQKLGIESRRDLSAALGDLDSAPRARGSEAGLGRAAGPQSPHRPR